MAVVVVAGRRSVLPYLLLLVAAPTLIMGSYFLGASSDALRTSTAPSQGQLLAFLLSALLVVVGFMLLVVGLWRLRGRE